MELTPKFVKQRLRDEVVSNNPIIDSLGRTQQALFVNEDGLYDVILDSRKPEAKDFRKWVTGDVLPSIRKTGGYIATSEQDSPELIMARALQIAKATIDKHKQMLEQAQERITLQEQVIKDAAPKVLFADSILASKTSCLIGELAKIITQNGCHIGQNKLFKWLRGNGYLCTRGEQYNLPLQKYVDSGLFEIKKSTHSENEVLITTSTTKVTPKGQQYFINKFLNH